MAWREELQVRDGKIPERFVGRDGVVKFIITVEGEMFFGNIRADKDRHKYIARQCAVPEDKIAGGGYADLGTQRLYGSSGDFGSFDRSLAQKLLPDWKVE